MTDFERAVLEKLAAIERRLDQLAPETVPEETLDAEYLASLPLAVIKERQREKLRRAA